MKPLALALLLLSAPSVRADEAAAPPVAATAPELLALESVLKEKQDAKSKGQLDPEQYKEFVAKFRSDLDSTIERVPPSVENKGAHARILSRLGPQERKQAMAGLDEALAENPDSGPLLLAKGHIHLENKDYAGAEASARQAWEASKHTDLGALSLLRRAEKRTPAVSAPPGEDRANSSMAAPGVVEDKRPVKLVIKSKATPSEVPPITQQAEGNQSEKSGFGAVATIGVIAGVLMLAWGAAPQETKDCIRELLWENHAQQLKYGAAAVAIGGLAYGGWALMAAAPAVAPAASATGGLVFAGAGTSGGAGTLGTTIAWQQAAVGALKAGTITLAVGKTINVASDARVAHRASQSNGSNGDQKGNNAGELTPPPQLKPKPVFLPIPIGSPPDAKDCSLRSGENVLRRFIDGTSLAPGFLLRHEGTLLGHTIERHVRKKPEYLRNRLRDDGIDDASTFFDQPTAERVIKEAVLRNIPRITAWSAKPFDDTQLPVLYEGSHLVPVGNSVTLQNPDMLLPRYDAMVRLQRVRDCRILIVTAFPQ